MSNYDQYLSFPENTCPDTFNNNISNYNREGGAVLMYIRHYISYDIRTDSASVSDHVESLTIEAKLSPTLPCLIFCMYRPPSSRIEYFNGMLDILDKATAEDKILSYQQILTLCDYKFDETLCSNPIHQMENMYGMTRMIT